MQQENVSAQDNLLTFVD